MAKALAIATPEVVCTQVLQKGLAELGVGPGQVIVEVLEEPSRGMFGIGARPARVRLQLLVAAAPVVQEVKPAPASPVAPAPNAEISPSESLR